MNTTLDLVVLVDENDRELGTMDKYQAHRNPAKLHRAISVYLFNIKGELLIQQRSEKKIVGALQWANTCCGNVWPGESYEDCAKRRLEAELGISNVSLQPIKIFRYSVQCNDEYGENEMDQVFIGSYEGDVKPNPDEVADTEYVNFKKLIADFKENNSDRELAPWFEMMLDDTELISQLQTRLETK